MVAGQLHSRGEPCTCPRGARLCWTTARDNENSGERWRGHGGWGWNTPSLFKVYSRGHAEPFEFATLEQAQAKGRELAGQGIESECRDADFNHVFTMGER